MAYLANSGTIDIKEFLDLFRDCFRPENNFLLKIKLDDWVWLKTHIHDENRGTLCCYRMGLRWRVEAIVYIL